MISLTDVNGKIINHKKNVLEQSWVIRLNEIGIGFVGRAWEKS